MLTKRTVAFLCSVKKYDLSSLICKRIVAECYLDECINILGSMYIFLNKDNPAILVFLGCIRQYNVPKDIRKKLVYAWEKIVIMESMILAVDIYNFCARCYILPAKLIKLAELIYECLRKFSEK